MQQKGRPLPLAHFLTLHGFQNLKEGRGRLKHFLSAGIGTEHYLNSKQTEKKNPGVFLNVIRKHSVRLGWSTWLYLAHGYFHNPMN